MLIFFSEPSLPSEEGGPTFRRAETWVARKRELGSTSWCLLWKEQLGWKWNISFSYIFLFACENWNCGKQYYNEYHEISLGRGARWMALGNYLGCEVAMTLNYTWFAPWSDCSENKVARARVHIIYTYFHPNLFGEDFQWINLVDGLKPAPIDCDFKLPFHWGWQQSHQQAQCHSLYRRSHRLHWWARFASIARAVGHVLQSDGYIPFLVGE